MPLVRISLMKGRPKEFAKKIAHIVYRTLADTLQVPGKDNLQVITEHDSGSLTYGPSDAGIRRDGLVVIQITLTEGRTAELKQTLFKTLLERLNNELSIRPEDLFVNLIEIKKENWAWRNT